MAQKYGYNPTELSTSPLKELLEVRKEPWRIFHGLEPGWLVSLADKAVIKPAESPDHDAFYKS